jgi:PAS domain S-box-containing protein
LWSVLWITFSDALLHLEIPMFPEVIWPLETIKGLLYVVVTAPLLYAFIRAREREEREARRFTESRLQSLSESNLIAILYWNTAGEITDANDAFLSLLGYTRDDLSEGALTWHDITAPEHRHRDLEAVQKLRRDGGHVVYEKEYIRKDGTRVPVLIGSAMMYGSKNRGIAYALNISERKIAQQRSAELEDQLRQSQKLEAVGQLASGVAHDFNNLLSVIIGYTSLIEGELAPDHRLRANTQRILNASAKATELIKKLLAFGRKQVLKPEPLDVNAVVRDLYSMLPPLVGERIELHLELAPNLWLVEADRQQLEQVIMNLVVNARDAMPGGGKLIISTSNVEDDDAAVLLSCRDTGEGMDEATKARIFEPFFTTKPPAEGTGLGLATVYGIVVQSGGSIKVSSEPGRGSTFDVFLPRARREGMTVIPGGRGQRRIATVGSETILLVEDENDLRSLLRHVLEGRGYKVLEAGNGEDAANLAKRHRGDIQLLLTDMIMPRMNGRDAAHLIRTFRPAIKVIYMTGYADDKILRPGSLSKDEALLEKPVVPDELALRIREMIESPEQGSARA